MSAVKEVCTSCRSPGAIASPLVRARWQPSQRRLGGADRLGQSKHCPLPKADGIPQTRPVCASVEAYLATPPSAVPLCSTLGGLLSEPIGSVVCTSSTSTTAGGAP